MMMMAMILNESFEFSSRLNWKNQYEAERCRTFSLSLARVGEKLTIQNFNSSCNGREKKLFEVEKSKS
jgi:hypothetical protein